jgi:hypothetical protein
VAAAAERAGHEVDVLDLAFVRSPRRALAEALRPGRHQVVGLGIRNLDNCVWAHPESYFEEVREVVAEVRRLSGAPLALGGSGFSVAPRGWVDRLKPDFGVVGEGEAAFTTLLDRIASGKPADGIAGVVRPGDPDDAYAPADRPPPADMGPPAHRHCRYARYLSGGGFVGVQSKRGCPFRCIYCTYPQLEGGRLRLREPDLVADEIEAVSRGNGRCHVFFTDGVFNASREHALAVCRELARRRSPVPWMAYCNPAGFDSELARAMVEAGCEAVELSLDAATAKMLEALGKPFGQADIHRCLKAVSDAGLPAAVHLLFGGPGETVDDVREAQRFLDSCPTPHAVFASIGLRVYAGTPLERIARDEGAIAPNADLFPPTYYVSPRLGRDPQGALDGVARRRWEWTTATDWSRPLMQVVQALVNRAGTRPQWRDVRNYGRYMRWGKVEPDGEGRGR